MEILLVVTLVAMLVGVTAPLLTNAVAGAQLKSAAREIAAALRHARNIAVSKQQEAAVSIDVQSRRYRVSSEQRDRALPGEVELKVFGAASESPDDTVGGVRFFPDGSSTGGRITVAMGERGYRIDVDWLLGKVTLSE
jgi:general secretion pathway protein H